MNRIVLNYIQSELGTEPKPVWTEIDEQAFESAISEIDLRKFPNLTYEQFKDLAFEKLYEMAESDVIESAFDMFDDLVVSLKEGGVIPYQDGGDVQPSGPKSKTIDGQTMLKLIKAQSTGNTRKDRKGFAAIKEMIDRNPYIQFQLFDDGRIDVIGLSDWDPGAGTGENFTNRPSLLKRITKGGENKSQRLYQELAKSIAFETNDLFKVGKPNENKVESKAEDKSTSESLDLSNNEPKKSNTEVNSTTEDNQREDTRTSQSTQTTTNTKPSGGGTGKRRVESETQRKIREAAEAKIKDLPPNEIEIIRNIAKGREARGDRNYWVNAINEYLELKQKIEQAAKKTTEGDKGAKAIIESAIEEENNNNTSSTLPSWLLPTLGWTGASALGVFGLHKAKKALSGKDAFRNLGKRTIDFISKKYKKLKKPTPTNNATPSANRGMLIPKPKPKILEMGGLSVVRPLSTAKEVIEKGRRGIKGAAKEYGSDAAIGFAQGLMGGTRKAENTNLNNVLEVASLLPVVGVPAQIANSLYRTKQEYDAGDLDWKDVVGEVADIGLSFVPGGKALKGTVKLVKKPSVIKKLII